MQKSIFYFIIILLFTQACSNKKLNKEIVLTPTYQEVKSKEDIHPVNDSLVKPIIYTRVISLKDLTIKEKKKKFIELLLPAVLVAQYELKEDLKRLTLIEKQQELNKYLVNQADSLFLEDPFSRYKTYDIQALKEKLQPHPASIVIGQAALETGWGTSRFFRDANNVFGIWSYNSKDNRMKALTTRDSVSIYVKRYNDIEASIKDYYGTIARVRAYRDFRRKRMQTNDPFQLIPHLNRYSELGKAYTRTLTYLIKQNNLTRFDNYQLDPSFFKERITNYQ